MEQYIYEYAWCFFLYSFFGWSVEVIFAAASKGHFVNRGFLNGPQCPIYGVGVCLVVALLYPYRDNLLLLYAGAVLLTTLVELLAGFLMEKLFHHRWWDYSHMPCNIGGYVCLLFSLVWGIACVLVVDVLHPLVIQFTAFIPHRLGEILLILFGVTFIADLVVTISCIAKLNERLRRLDEASKALRQFSDTIGESLAGPAIALKQKGEAKRAAFQARKPGYVERRLIEAFPNMRSKRYQEALESFREQVKRWKEEKKNTKT